MIGVSSVLRRRFAFCAALLILCAGAPAVSGNSLAPYLSLPPEWEGRIIYYRSFERAKPEINSSGLKEAFPIGPEIEGVRGQATRAEKGLVLDSAALSPHRPLTVSFWWALQKEPDKDSGFNLAHLTNGKGFISHFVRSGPWCGLDRPAGVVQVYHLPAVRNINGIYDRDFVASLKLKAGEWHHTAVVLTAASKVAAYTDGQKVFETPVTGRFFRASDRLNQLILGNPDGLPLAIDEVVILNRPLSDDEIATYVLAIRQMHRTGYPLGL